MTKAELIAAKLAEPIKVGDYININISYEKSSSEQIKVGRKKEWVKKMVPMSYNESAFVAEIIESKEHGTCYRFVNLHRSIPSEVNFSIKERKDAHNIAKAEWVTQSIYYCGENPFKPRIRCTFNSGTIESLLFYGGYGRRFDNYNIPEYKKIGPSLHKSEQKLVGKTHGGINFNPYVIDKDGNRQHYQRPLVWTLEQKQLLIHSIFNRIEIGKFIFKYRSWDDLAKEMIESGHGFDYECVDGKQRYHAILEYIQNKFPSQNDIYFNDLSPDARGEFMKYDNLTMGKLDEDATSEDILKTFLTINFTGTPMSKDHIEFVQSIKLK